MALTDKNIIITPNTGQTSDPTIVFSGADTSTSAQNISLKVYPISSGTLSFEGSSGQLFSISNKLSGTIFSVNDISGIPSIEVLDTGIIKLGQYGGNILLGTGSDDSNKLQVAGGISVSGNITVGGTVYANVIGTITTATSAATAYALANTSTTYVGRAVLADTATTATSAATAYALANTSTTYVGRAVLADTATTATSAATAYAVVGGTLNSTAYTSSFNGGLTASTTIASTTTYTTGGITLTSQTIATGSLWRIRAHGTFVAVSSATARNAQIAAYWGTTALPVISVVVLTSTARTTSWELEFIIKGTSTSAGWTTGYFNNSITAALGTVSINSATPATTTVPTGAQTLDLRFSSSVGQIAGESWSVQNITIERLM